MNSNAIGIIDLDPGELTLTEGGNYADPRLALLAWYGEVIAAGWNFGYGTLGPALFGS